MQQVIRLEGRLGATGVKDLKKATQNVSKEEEK
jgi:hypothetical protein